MITVFILDDHIKSQSIPSEDLTDLPDLCLLSIPVFIIRKIDSNSLKRKAVLEGKPLRTDNNSNNVFHQSTDPSHKKFFIQTYLIRVTELVTMLTI